MSSWMKLFGIIFLSLLLVACSGIKVSDPEEEGNASETVANIEGTIKDTSNTPVDNANVVLYKANYNPGQPENFPAPDSSLTNNVGRYELLRPDPGIFNIIVQDSLGRIMAYIPQIIVDEDSTATITADAVLQDPGGIRVSLANLKAEVGDHIYIPGTNIISIIDSTLIEKVQLTLSTVPPGIYTDVIFYSPLGEVSLINPREHVEVKPMEFDSVGDFSALVDTTPPIDTTIIVNNVDTVLERDTNVSVVITPENSGVILDGQTGLADGAIISLIPDGFNMVLDVLPDSLIDTTLNGNYTFANLAKGVYDLQVRSADTSTFARINRINISDESQILIPKTLETPGVLEVHHPEGYVERRGVLFIPGSFGFIQTYTLQPSVIDTFINMASGNYEGVFFSASNDLSNPIEIAGPFEIKTGEILVLHPFSLWQNQYSIQINTSATGANVTENQINFPLVIRLDANNYNMAHSNEKGLDVRFTKLDMTPLAFEIEIWDSSASTAQIWVNVDTIFGNNANQTILMHSGRTGPVYDSSLVLSYVNNGNLVFDTTDGFAGVWHMGDLPSDPNKVKDETFNAHLGTKEGKLVNELDQPGLFGSALHFSGDSSYISVTNSPVLPQTDNVTLSAWVNWTGLTGENQYLFYNGNSSTNGFGIMINDSRAGDPLEVLMGGRGGRFSVTSLTQGDWAYVTAIRRTGVWELHLNSISLQLQYEGGLSEDVDAPTNSTVIGSDDEVKNFFNGKMDEVRFSKVPRSNDWVLLNYETQKINSTVVTIQSN